MSEFENRIDLKLLNEKVDKIKTEARKALVGQDKMLDLILVALLAEGHVLIEGVPGVAKTLTARLTARMIDAEFKRIQFTPDLMPADVLGTSIFNPKRAEFDYKKGPIFSNLGLIDEINRAPAKTQASLFEVMEEKQVTNDGTTYPLDPLFMVLATQNPIEQEGTYRLPEAQLDRFIFKIKVDYPKLEEEFQVLHLVNGNFGFKQLSFIEPVINRKEVIEIRENLRQILTKDSLVEYIAHLVGKTRSHPSLYLGASPRASIDLLRSSKAYAAMQGRDFVTPEDIQYLFKPVVDHRIILNPEAEMQGLTTTEVCQQIIEQVLHAL